MAALHVVSGLRAQLTGPACGGCPAPQEAAPLLRTLSLQPKGSPHCSSPACGPEHSPFKSLGQGERYTVTAEASMQPASSSADRQDRQTVCPSASTARQASRAGLSQGQH